MKVICIWISLLGLFSSTLSAQTDPPSPFWEGVSGPHGLGVWSLLIAGDGSWYAGTASGRVFRKGAGEILWKQVLNLESETIMVLRESSDSKIYVGTSTGRIACTTDEGITWTDELSEIPFEEPVRAMIETMSGDLIVAARKSIYRKVPSGSEFSWGDRIELPFGIHALYKGRTGVLYAGTGRGLYQSVNDGRSWIEAGLNEVGISVLSIIENQAGDLLAGTNGGLRVQRVGTTIWDTLGDDHVAGGTVRHLSVHGAYTFAGVVGDGYYVSTDELQWEFVQVDGHDGRAGVFYDDNTESWVIGTENGVWGGSLTPQNFAPLGLPPSIQSLSSGASLFAATRTRLYRSSNGQPWETIFSTGEGTITAYDVEEPGDIRFVGLDGGLTGGAWVGIVAFLDGEQWWRNVGFPADVKQVNNLMLTFDGIPVIATDNGLFFIDRSKSFHQWLPERLSMAGVPVLLLDEDVTGQLYAGTDRGLYVSTNGGHSWTGPLAEEKRITSLTLVGPEEGFFVADDGLYYFADLTAKPRLVEEIQSPEYVYADSKGHLFVLARGGSEVYYRESINDEFELTMAGLDAVEFTSLYAHSNYVYLATDRGLYRHAIGNSAPLTLEGLGIFTYDGNPHTATAVSNPNVVATVTYNGIAEPPINAGRYRVDAVLADPYAGRVQGYIQIDGIPAQVTITGLGSYVYDREPKPVVTSTEPAGLPVEVVYNNLLEPPVNAGIYGVKVSIKHPYYTGTAEGQLIIEKALQTISFDPPDKFTDDAPFQLLATASSDLPVSISLVSGPATLEADMVTLTREPGTVQLLAVQEGDDNYEAADVVEASFDVRIVTEVEKVVKGVGAYPVPASNSVEIICEDRILSLRILTLQGTAIDSFIPQERVSQYTLDVSSYPNGIYMAIIQTDSGHKQSVMLVVAR